MPLTVHYFAADYGLHADRDSRSGSFTEKAHRMDAKLTLLFLLMGVVIGLSHLGDDNLTRMRRQLIDRRWRGFLRGRRKV